MTRDGYPMCCQICARRGGPVGGPGVPLWICDACREDPGVQAKAVKNVIKAMKALRKSAIRLAGLSQHIRPGEAEMLADEAQLVLLDLQWLTSPEGGE